MLWKHLTAVAGLAATTTQALMVVPDVSASDKDIVKALPFDAAASALQSQTLKLNCPDCPVKLRQPDGRFATKTDITSHLELTFEIEATPNGDRRLVNNFELYPNAGSWYSSLRAPQVLDFAVAAKGHPRKMNPSTPQLGYTLGIRPVAADEGHEQLSLLEFDLQILEVGYSFIDGIPTVLLKLIQTPSGELMIASIEKIKPQPTRPEHHEEPEEECENVFCSWRSSIIKGLKSLRPNCSTKPHRNRHGHGHGHHTHPHKHMHGQFRHHHTWGRLLQNITWSILLPVLIGLVAGVSVAIIGMMFGSVFVFLWRLVVRRQTPWMRGHCRRHAGRSCRKTAQRETALADEKANLLESQDEDVPDLPEFTEKDISPLS